MQSPAGEAGDGGSHKGRSETGCWDGDPGHAEMPQTFRDSGPGADPDSDGERQWAGRGGGGEGRGPGKMGTPGAGDPRDGTARAPCLVPRSCVSSRGGSRRGPCLPALPSLLNLRGHPAPSSPSPSAFSSCGPCFLPASDIPAVPRTPSAPLHCTPSPSTATCRPHCRHSRGSDPFWSPGPSRLPPPKSVPPVP